MTACWSQGSKDPSSSVRRLRGRCEGYDQDRSAKGYQPPREGPQFTPTLLEGLAQRVSCLEKRAYWRVVSPRYGQILGNIPICAPQDAQEAVRRARGLQPAWAKLEPKARARIVLRFHDLLLARREEILDLVQCETGKARRDAQEELLDAAIVAQFYATRSPAWLRPRRAGGTFLGLTQTWVYRHPVGVMAPWNYPLSMAVSEPIPALMAGNAVVFKPDPRPPSPPCGCRPCRRRQVYRRGCSRWSQGMAR